MSWRAVAFTGVLVAFPIAAVVLFTFIPPEQQMLLALDHRQPRWYQFVTAVVIHRDADHLWSNVVSFAFAYVAWVQLIRLGGQPARGRKIAAIALVIGPVGTMVLSLLAYDAVLTVDISLDRGLSGMVGLMTGLLIYEMVTICMRAVGDRLGAIIAAGYIAVMLLTLQVVNGQLPPLFGESGIALLLGGGGVLAFWGRTRLRRWGRAHPELMLTLLVAGPWSVFLFVGLLPASMQGPDGLTNVVAHGGGLVLGMLIALLVQTDQVPIPPERVSSGS